MSHYFQQITGRLHIFEMLMSLELVYRPAAAHKTDTVFSSGNDEKPVPVLHFGASVCHTENSGFSGMGPQEQKCVPVRSTSFERENRIVNRHRMTVRYIAQIWDVRTLLAS